MKKNAPVIRIGLLGLGTVGSGVVEILSRHSRLIAERVGVQLRISRALVRSRRRRVGAAAKVALTRTPAAVVEADDVDLVVELLGGIEPARGLMLQALALGKPVVTANKAVLAAHGSQILQAAQRAGTDVYFEAAVAGGVPIIRTLREALASDHITALSGILNGTTNYVLEQMAQGAEFKAALREAQQRGFAEADPTLDVTGQDAADKLAILTLLAFGRAVRPDAIPTEGITRLTPEVLADARQLGYHVKLLATARRVGASGTPLPARGRRRSTSGADGFIDARVHPCFVPAGHVLSAVPGAQNAIAVSSDALGTTLYQGAGAGGLPTGSAVVSDIIEAARNLRAGISERVVTTGSRNAPRLVSVAQSRSAYYLRLQVADRPGVLASVANLLAHNDISLATVLQRERAARSGAAVPLVIVTHRTQHGAMQRALRAVGRLAALRGRVNVVRIE